MNNPSPNLLAISGSLRKKSSNSALLSAMISMVPSNVTVTTYDGMGLLPHFNPDLDTDAVSVHVTEWRNHLRNAEGILICTPEYAKGIPGSFKNALDWVVSSGEFVNKPVAVVSASPHPLGGEAAYASLLGTLSMMNAVIVEEGTLKVPFVSLKLGANGDIVDEETKIQAQKVVDALVLVMG